MSASLDVQPFIEVHALEKSYSSRSVLKNLNFSAASGEVVAIVGPNGAGKTTFLRILSTLARPDHGDVRLGDYLLPRESQRARRLIGAVFHHPMLYGDLSAEENLAFFAGLGGLGSCKARCKDILEKVGLASRRDDPVCTFSRGMQQRLSLGRVMLSDPPVFLLDEPYSSLDSAGSALLDGFLREWIADGKCVVMASHDLAHTALVSTRIDVIAGGRFLLSIPRGSCPPEDIPERVSATLRAYRTQ